MQPFPTFFTSISPSAVPTITLFTLNALISTTYAQDRTSEAGEASIKDATSECAPYYYAPVANKILSFPTIWQPAKILSDDANAQGKWASISGSVPTNIPVKGTITGDFSNVTYSPDDPDCWWTSHQCATPKLAGLPPDIANVPEPNTLGYGFDDGPNCSHNAFYDYLQSQNQKATMFFIGSNVMDWPLEAQRGIADGHEICVHTWSHRYMTALESPDAFAELYYSTSPFFMQAIKLVTGVTPTCWRPPFGDVDDRIRAIAHGLGLRTIIWQYDSNDWKVGSGNVTAADVDGNYWALIAKANAGAFNEAGAIILTHELNNFTMEEAVKLYPQLRAAFKYIVPVGVAMNITQPYIETNYTLPTFQQYVSGTTVMNGNVVTDKGGKPIQSNSNKPAQSNGDKPAQSKGGAIGLNPMNAITLAASISCAALVLGFQSV